MKVSLLAAIAAANIVVVDSFLIDGFTDQQEPRGIRMECGRDVGFEFDEQEVELDEQEGVVTAVDRDGDECEISLQVTMPLTMEAVMAYQARNRG